MKIKTVALVTEGISEQWVLKKIVEKFHKDIEIDFPIIQPQNFNNKQKGAGGWLEVLKFISDEEELTAALVESDFLIVQIDTDQSENINFGIPHLDINNKTKTTELLFNDILEKLQSLISEKIKKEFGHKIIFAICIHTIECWLLPLFVAENHKSKITNCTDTLNAALGKKDITQIAPKGNGNIRRITYNNVLSNIKNKKDVETCAKYNYGFEQFVNSINSFVIQ